MTCKLQIDDQRHAIVRDPCQPGDHLGRTRRLLILIEKYQTGSLSVSVTAVTPCDRAGLSAEEVLQ